MYVQKELWRTSKDFWIRSKEDSSWSRKILREENLEAKSRTIASLTSSSSVKDYLGFQANDCWKCS